MVTEVIFRKYNTKPYEVFAVFPYMISSGSKITSYEHAGQHGACDRFYHEFSRPCSELEYQDLLNELKKIGYDDLKIIKKINNSKYLDAVYGHMRDLTKTTKAFRSEGIEGYVDTAFCPYCEKENTGDIIIKKENNVIQSSEFDTEEANAKIFECTCFSCGHIFRVDYFKEV